jgi:uncharacterized protein (DUF1330 family)
MTAYLLGAIDVDDPVEYSRYREGAVAVLARFDAEVLSADDTPDVLEGVAPAAHLFVVKFSSMERLKAFYESADYQAIVGYRHRASKVVHIMAMRGLNVD